MSFIKQILALALLLLGSTLYGQDRFTLFWEPQLAINYGVATNYSHNFTLAKRSYLYREGLGRFQVRQLELSHFSKLSLSDLVDLGIGFQYRIRDNFEPDSENEFRITEQFNLLRRGGSLRLGHRVRAEQRIRPSRTIHRFRYRLAADTPLNGTRLDIGESYLVGSVESLYSLGKKQKPEWDQRIELTLGWLVAHELKLETGLEYRLESINQTLGHTLLLNSGLVFTF